MAQIKIHKHINTSNGGSQSCSVEQGDDHIRVVGQTDDGGINRAIMLDDPDAETKLRELLEAIRDHQKTEIKKWKENVEKQYDQQFNDLMSKVDQYFST